MSGYPQFSLWISITLSKIYISCIIINRDKNTFELVGTVLKQLSLFDTPESNKMTRTSNIHSFHSSKQMSDFMIAQLVAYCTGIVEVMGWNPVPAVFQVVAYKCLKYSDRKL